MRTKKNYSKPTNEDLGQTSNWSKLVAAYLPVARPTILDRLVCFQATQFQIKDVGQRDLRFI